MSGEKARGTSQVASGSRSKPVGWGGVTNPDLRQRVEEVRKRSERRIADRAAGISPERGRWVVVDGKVVREPR